MMHPLFRGVPITHPGYVDKLTPIIGDGIHWPKCFNYEGTCWIDGMHSSANDWVQVDPKTLMISVNNGETWFPYLHG